MSARYREKIIFTGQYAEVEVFPTFKKPRARKRKYRPTSEMQEILNQQAAERRFRRLIHANYTGNDYKMGFDFSDVYLPDTVADARRLFINFTRRLKRLYKKNGVELKFAYSIEEANRFHIHAFINNGGYTREEIEKCWGMGYANADSLQFSEFGVMDLVNYTQKQHLQYKRWSCSRNHVQPEEREHFITTKTVHDYSDNWNCQDLIDRRFNDYFLVLDDSLCYTNTTNGFDYIRLFLCKKDADLSFYATSFAEFDDRVKRKIDSRDLNLPPDDDEWLQGSLWYKN